MREGKFPEVCPKDFRDLTRAALITGGRYSEVGALKVEQFAVPNRSIYLIQSKPKKENKLKIVFLTDEEVEFFNERVLGKPPGELIFRRAGVPWKKSNQQEREADTPPRGSNVTSATICATPLRVCL